MRAILLKGKRPALKVTSDCKIGGYSKVHLQAVKTGPGDKVVLLTYPIDGVQYCLKGHFVSDSEVDVNFSNVD